MVLAHLLDIASLTVLRCLRMLSFHDVTLDEVKTYYDVEKSVMQLFKILMICRKSL